MLVQRQIFPYVKASKLPLSAFYVDVLEGPFATPKSEGSVSPLRKIYLSEEVFRTDVRPDLMARVVRWQRNKAMQGTHKTKTKGEVSGTGKKPWRQKGTGRARQGSLRNPHFRGGGAAFGPAPRDHEHKLNKKERRLGLRSALAARLQEGKLFVVDSLKPKLAEGEEVKEGEEPFVKTRQIAEYVEKLSLKHVVLVDDVQRDTLVRACRNARQIHYLPQVGLNVYAILRAKEVMVTVNALRILEDRLSETRQRERRYAKRGWTAEDAAAKAKAEQEKKTEGTVVEKKHTKIEQRRILFKFSQQRKKSISAPEAASSSQ